MKLNVLRAYSPKWTSVTFTWTLANRHKLGAVDPIEPISVVK